MLTHCFTAAAERKPVAWPSSHPGRGWPTSLWEPPEIPAPGPRLSDELVLPAEDLVSLGEREHLLDVGEALAVGPLGDHPPDDLVALAAIGQDDPVDALAAFVLVRLQGHAGV